MPENQFILFFSPKSSIQDNYYRIDNTFDVYSAADVYDNPNVLSSGLNVLALIFNDPLLLRNVENFERLTLPVAQSSDPSQTYRISLHLGNNAYRQLGAFLRTGQSDDLPVLLYLFNRSNLRKDDTLFFTYPLNLNLSLGTSFVVPKSHILNVYQSASNGTFIDTNGRGYELFKEFVRNFLNTNVNTPTQKINIDENRVINLLDTPLNTRDYKTFSSNALSVIALLHHFADPNQKEEAKTTKFNAALNAFIMKLKETSDDDVKHFSRFMRDVVVLNFIYSIEGNTNFRPTITAKGILDKLKKEDSVFKKIGPTTPSPPSSLPSRPKPLPESTAPKPTTPAPTPPEPTPPGVTPDNIPTPPGVTPDNIPSPSDIIPTSPPEAEDIPFKVVKEKGIPETALDLSNFVIKSLLTLAIGFVTYRALLSLHSAGESFLHSIRNYLYNESIYGKLKSKVSGDDGREFEVKRGLIDFSEPNLDIVKLKALNDTGILEEGTAAKKKTRYSVM